MVQNYGNLVKGGVYMRDQWSVIVRKDTDKC